MENNNRYGLESLYNIVNDLWGTLSPAAETPARQETAPVAPAPKAPSFPPFEQFWRTADETVDWTEALACDHTTDGLTTPEMWQFFHTHAAAVLDGDLAAYVDVLNAANPLGDLLPYACEFNVQAESADRLTVRFDALPSYLDQPEAERKRYLAGICLRAARDLMALLPVCEVAVCARREGQPLLEVTFTRAAMQKVRFSFVDPVAFALSCGGVFAG